VTSASVWQETKLFLLCQWASSLPENDLLKEKEARVKIASHIEDKSINTLTIELTLRLRSFELQGGHFVLCLKMKNEKTIVRGRGFHADPEII
jgi:hypothetical protein